MHEITLSREQRQRGFVILVVFVVLRSIPWLGLLLSMGVTLVGLGAMWLVFRDRFTRRAVPQLVLTPA